MAEAREYISLSEAAIYSGCYSQEYLSLRARHGKLKAVKFGRNWVITKEWLDEYLERVNNYKNNQKKKERGRLIDRYLLPVRKLRLITVTYVLVFLLLSAGIVFGYPYLEPALNSVSGFIEDTSSQLAADIWDFSNLTRGVEGVGEFSQNIFVGSKKGIESFSGNLKFGLAFLREEVDKDLVSPFKNFFSFFRSKFQPEMTFGEEYVKNDIQNLKNFFRKIGGAIAYPFVKTYQFVVRPWSEKIDEEKIIEEIIKQRPEITTEEIENIRAQIEKLKEEGIVAKEIVKEVIKITQIEPVKEITREITKIDDEELKKLKSQIAGIQEWETDIKTLQVLTSKLQTHPPQTQVITAPVYIGSQGLQVGGVGIFSSLGVSGSAGITNLGVGGSTSLGSDSSDKLTVQATSEFFSPVTIQNTFTVGDATNYLIINSTGNLTTTGTLSAEGDVTISGASSLATTTITGDLIVNTNQLYVDTATGYVGIGTSTPATDLHILGSGTQLRIATSTSIYADFTIDSTGYLTIAPTGGILSLNTSGVQNKLMVYSTSTDYIEMYHSGTNAIIFANTGDIEIGATGTDVIIGDFGNAANLVFEEDSYISGQGQNTISFGVPGDIFNLNISDVTYNYGGDISIADTLTVSGTTTLAVSSGRVGIGTASPTSTLDVLDTSDAQLTLTQDSSSYAQFKVGTAGDLRITASGGGSSDDDIKMTASNLWVCSGDSIDSYSCPSLTLSDTGNLVVKGDIHIEGTIKECADGYIRIPGNPYFGTSDFCVMKYEAKSCVNETISTNCSAGTKSDGSGDPIENEFAASYPENKPWVTIPQNEADDLDAQLACERIGTGYHLMTKEEAQTINRYIADNPQNWVSGEVGSGCMYGGHMDNDPAASLVAATDDMNGWSGTGEKPTDAVACPFVTGAGGGKEQRRTMYLPSGDVIWDWSGNVWEWLDETCTQGTGEGNWDSDAAWQEWSAADLDDYERNTLGPVSNTLISNPGGTGKYYGCTAGGNAFTRGGYWDSGVDAGVFALNLYNSPSDVVITIGFRCAR